MKEIPFVGFVFSMIQFPVGHLSFWYQSNKELRKNGAEKKRKPWKKDWMPWWWIGGRREKNLRLGLVAYQSLSRNLRSWSRPSVKYLAHWNGW